MGCISSQRSKIRKWFAFCVLLLVVTILIRLFSRANNLMFYKPVRDLHIGCERPGVHLKLLKWKQSSKLETYTNHQKIIAATCFLDIGQKSIDTIGDLVGLVNISNTNEALRFVRFSTSPSIGGLWSDNEKSMKMFEIKSYSLFLKESGPNTQIKDSTEQLAWHSAGSFGVLPTSLFNLLGFADPKVAHVGSEYQITRWLVEFKIDDSPGWQLRDYGHAVALVYVRETVSTDGKYNRITIARRSPDVGHGVYWTMGGISPTNDR